MNNRLLNKFLANEKSYGLMSHLRSTEAIEAIALAGFDYVIIDTEHSPINYSESAKYILAANKAGISPIVRIDDISREKVLKALDAGAHGIIGPHIHDVQEVKKLVEYAKFAPLGQRGYCPTADGLWGFDEVYDLEGIQGYMKQKNEKTLLIPQCETVEALESIEEIINVEGVDGIMFGPFDLSISMGIPGQFDHPDFQAAIDRVLKAVNDAGKFALMFGKGDFLRENLNKGYHSGILGVDITYLINGLRETLHNL